MAKARKYTKAQAFILIEFLKTLASSRQSSAYCRVCKKHRNYIYNPDQAIPRDMFCIRGEHWQDPSLPF